MRHLTHCWIGYYRHSKTSFPLPVLTHSAPLPGLSFNPLENNMENTKKYLLEHLFRLLIRKKNSYICTRLYWLNIIRSIICSYTKRIGLGGWGRKKNSQGNDYDISKNKPTLPFDSLESGQSIEWRNWPRSCIHQE